MCKTQWVENCSKLSHLELTIERDNFSPFQITVIKWKKNCNAGRKKKVLQRIAAPKTKVSVYYRFFYFLTGLKMVDGKNALTLELLLYCSKLKNSIIYGV